MSEEVDIPKIVSEWIDNHIKIVHGEVKWQTTGKVATRNSINVKLTQATDMYLNEKQYIVYIDAMKQLQEMEKAALKEGEYFYDPVAFCRHYLDEWGVKVDGSECITKQDENAGRVPASKTNLVNLLKIQLYNYNNNIPVDADGNNVAPFLKITELLMPSVEKLVSDVRYKAIGTVRAQIKYDPNSKFPLDEWIKDLFDVYGINYVKIPEHITMFKHLLYTIKRGIFNKMSEERRPMHVFFSRKQGTGKTTLLKKLCSPFLYAYSENGLLSKLGNGKEQKAMVRNKALVDFQELAIPRSIRSGNGEVDMDTIARIKAAISSEVISDRGMYSAENEVESQQTTFVSSSNMHIFDVIQDGGGMRRFWEYSLEPTQPNGERWVKANKLLACMVDVYSCIDECDERGYFHDDTPEFKNIEMIQEKYAKADAFSKFEEMEGLDVQSFEEKGYDRVPLVKLCKMFNRYQERQGNGKWKLNSLLILLAQKDILPEKIEKDGKVTEYVYILTKGKVTPTTPSEIKEALNAR